MIGRPLRGLPYFAAFLFTASLSAAPADLWPAQLPKAAEAATRAANLDSAIASLPPELAPAIRFEQAFLRVVARAPEADWLPAFRALAATTTADPVSAGVREAAKAWLARAQMEKINDVLEKYYAQHVQFPAALAEVEKNLTADLRADPWGDPWTYQPHAPQGFSKESRQRYQLGPKRFPALGDLREATVRRKPFTPPAWKIALREVAGNRAVEFQQNGVVAGLIAAGGKINDYSLLYVGDHWALLAATDQLFAVTF